MRPRKIFPKFASMDDLSSLLYSFSMENRVPFVFILDEMTTFKVRDFEKLPSVLLEYGAAFLLLTQSEGKLEKLYSKLDRSSIETNFGNIFLKCPLILERFPIPINSPGSNEAKSFDSYISSFCVLMVTLELRPPPLLPVVAFRTEKEISDNYTKILKDIERVLGMEEIDVNSLFTDR